MEFITLGKTKILASRSGLNTHSLENVDEQTQYEILDTAYKSGINFYEIPCGKTSCALAYGKEFYDKRKDVILSVTCEITDDTNIAKEIDAVLENLTMDYIDIFSIETNSRMFFPQDEIYTSLLKAKEAGKINFIGFYSKKLELAMSALHSGLYDIIQYPINIFSTDEELALIENCEKQDIGLIARCPFASGKIENVPIAFGFLRKFENLVPMYGVQSNEQIQKLLYFESNPPIYDEKFYEDLKNLQNENA